MSKSNGAVEIAFDCNRVKNNDSFVTHCKLKFAGIRYLKKHKMKNHLKLILHLYNEIYQLKSTYLGTGHHQTIDVLRRIVETENMIDKTNKNKKRKK